jgi:hypothetical protein
MYIRLRRTRLLKKYIGEGLSLQNQQTDLVNQGAVKED